MARTSKGLQEIKPTSGAVNGSNKDFIFPSLPTYIVNDGVQLKALDDNGGTNWSWDPSTNKASVVAAPNNSLYGLA